MIKNPPTMQERQVRSLGREDPWKRNWHPTPVFLLGESPGQRSLEGCIQSMGSRSQTQLSAHTEIKRSPWRSSNQLNNCLLAHIRDRGPQLNSSSEQTPARQALPPTLTLSPFSCSQVQQLPGDQGDALRDQQHGLQGRGRRDSLRHPGAAHPLRAGGLHRDGVGPPDG